MLNILGTFLIASGVIVLLLALRPVRRIIRQLHRSPIVTKWYALAALILCFVLGYTGYGLLTWEHYQAWQDLMVPGVFLAGAVFVLVTARLSLQTATDLKRVALLEHENITDPLIGIYNRRFMERRLEDEYARAKRYANPISLLLLDIDHFKSVNDNFGHQAGDEVLKHLGKLLLNAVRDVDVVTRYGGEELLIIAPNTSRKEAVQLAERLREYVMSHDLVLTGSTTSRQALQITVSIGVAALDESVGDCETLVQHADQALYRAKEQGRNRVVAYP